MTRHVDALVIGSGPGGAVTARCLAEAGRSVLVVEEGAWVEAGSVEPYSVEQMQRQYRNSGLTVALGRPSIAYTEGCGAGGGSEVNSGLYHRPSAELLAAWSRAYAIEGLDAPSLERHSAFVEKELSVTPHPPGALPESSDLLRRGARALGWSGFDVPRWVRYRERGEATVAERQTMTRTYLPEALSAGAELWTQTRAGRISVRDGRDGRDSRGATAELVRRAGDGRREQPERVRADAVFVCAGATQTPALLQRSGIRRNVGAHLSVHPTVKVVAEFDHEVNAPGDLPTYQVKEFGSWLSFGGSASRQALIALSLSDSWSEFGTAVDRWRQQSVYYAAIQSVGTGSVRALPGFRDPLVTYRLTRADGERLRTGLARLMHLMLAAGATAIYPSYAGARVVRTPLDVTEAVQRFSMAAASVMTVHLTGTAAMGEDRRKAAVGSFGRVHGLESVYVNDASMLPWAPGVNPQGTLMAIAHRNVDAFLRDEETR